MRPCWPNNMVGMDSIHWNSRVLHIVSYLKHSRLRLGCRGLAGLFAFMAFRWVRPQTAREVGRQLTSCLLQTSRESGAKWRCWRVYFGVPGGTIHAVAVLCATMVAGSSRNASIAEFRCARTCEASGSRGNRIETKMPLNLGSLRLVPPAARQSGRFGIRQ